MGYGNNPGGYGGDGYGTDAGQAIPILVGVQGCIPILKDTLGGFWALSVDDAGELTLTSLNFTPGRQQNPFLDSGNGTWQLSVDSGGFLNVTQSSPGVGQFVFPYIPLISAGGFTYKLTVDFSGNLSVTNTLDSHGNAVLLPDAIPRPFDVTMSNYGDPGEILFCSSCNNASVTAGADLSLWCCACNSFVSPEDTNCIRFLDE